MGQFDQTIDDTGASLTPDPSLDPLSGFQMPGPPPAARPPVQMPTPPQAPGPPGNMQRIVSMALMGLAAGLGPRHGGAGVSQGLMLGQHNNDVQRQQTFKDQQVQYHEQQQEAIRQQSAQAEQERLDIARQGAFQKAMGMIQTEVKTIPDKATYDKRVEGYANLMRASGYRVDANWLRTAVPYVAPTAKKIAQDAVSGLFKNPLLQQQLKDNPQMVASGSIMVDLNGDGITEKRTIQEVMDAAGMSLLLDDAGKPLGFSASADGPIANIALKAKIAQFKAENRREPTPKEMDGLVTAARTTPKDPLTEELGRQRLADAKEKASNPALKPQVQRRVDMKSKGFEALPVVKKVQTMAEAVSFAKSLDPHTKNPADDQALIYAFAKAMDPDSVVREGEYATVQRYAQSWADSFGFNAQRIFSNTAFLTPQARQNMKTTITTKFEAGRAQYDNVRRSYAKQINQITGGTDGDTYLTDFAGAFPEDAAASARRKLDGK